MTNFKFLKKSLLKILIKKIVVKNFCDSKTVLPSDPFFVMLQKAIRRSRD